MGLASGYLQGHQECASTLSLPGGIECWNRLTLEVPDWGQGEMAQLVENLLCRHEDLSSVPRCHIGKAGYGGECLSFQGWRGEDRRLPGAPWLPNIA